MAVEADLSDAGSGPVPLVLPPELTHVQAPACLELLTRSADQQGQARQPLQVDAGLLERFDSSALAVLLGLRRVSQRRGRGFEVLHLPERLHTLAQLYGIASLLTDVTTGSETEAAAQPEPVSSP